MDFHPSFIIISFKSLVDFWTPFYFIVIPTFPKPLFKELWIWITSILIAITSFSEIIFITFLHGIKLIPKFIYWSYLHDINLLLKFNLHSSSYIHVVSTTPHASWNIVWLHLHQRLRQSINHPFIFLQLDYLHPHCIPLRLPSVLTTDAILHLQVPAYIFKTYINEKVYWTRKNIHMGDKPSQGLRFQ